MIRRQEIIPVLPSRRRVPLPLAIFFGALSVAGFLVLAAGIWFVVLLASMDWHF